MYARACVFMCVVFAFSLPLFHVHARAPITALSRSLSSSSSRAREAVAFSVSLVRAGSFARSRSPACPSVRRLARARALTEFAIVHAGTTD